MSYNGFDSFRPDLVIQNANNIISQGFTKVGLYYFENSAFKILLTKDYAERLSNVGFEIFSIYENGEPISASYFSTTKGSYDGHIGLAKAISAGQTLGTPIYFAVDYDASDSDYDNYIKPYFMALQPILKSNGYLAGAYANGLVLMRLLADGLISHDFLSQSKGFQGYRERLAQPTPPCITQGPVATLNKIDIDWDSIQDNAGTWAAHA